MSEAQRIEPIIEPSPAATQINRPGVVITPLTIAPKPEMMGRILTMDGQQWGNITAELRQLVALIEPATLADDADLMVSSQHLHDPYVLAFMDRLDRAGVSFQVVSSTLSDIRSIYQNAGKSNDGSSVDSTQRQQEVIRIIGAAHARGASDVHFIVGHEITHISFREHGLLHEYGQIQSTIGNELCSSLYNSMCDVKSEGYYQPEIRQDARLARTYVDQLGLFGARVATRPLVDGPLMVLRLIYDDQQKQSVDDLGFLPEQILLFKRLRSLPYGVILLTGPTGSGKSKSLQVQINLLAEESKGTKHILTVEDPPEYPMRANQSPLNSNETWDEAITNSMRLDPDILMYGEIRDLASAKAALRGGMTGHLVLSTLHTNNAVAAIPRLIDMGADESLITDPALMAGLINQSLLPTLCHNCRVPARSHLHTLDAQLVERLKKLTQIDQVYLVGPGCAHCRGMGVNGRTVVSEMILPTHRFMEIIRKKGPSAARNYWVKQMGGITKVAHTLIKVNAGLIDPRMAEAVVGPLDFDSYMLDPETAETDAHA
ncbi:Flp pilus assembly complex ATPase component TadA [Pseudomonas phytophila]|uniref:Flp pilus assembly complex ATPase component TadA n=1 Tax=Pseudomonas phytophila TaxID=2867264 RepID=A0ABY6FH54_9PSED|nr:ATPase, T2SS/T4P/T4SS family [Pseudomonas phytophila]UXZ97260.1 Flp pilus assembly complex ATPase component TadA [Pseudomonas phytophila]